VPGIAIAHALLNLIDSNTIHEPRNDSLNLLDGSVLAEPARMKNAIRRTILATVLLLGASAVAPANAAVIINVTEVGGDVVFAVTGSLNITGATVDDTYSTYGLGFIPGGANWYLATGSGGPAVGYALTSFAGAFGTSTNYFSSPTTTSGTNFFIWGESGNVEQVGLPVGYISGSAIVSGMVFGSATIAGFTMIPGTYLYPLPNDTITLNIGGRQAVVPEPAMLLLLGGGLAAGVRRFRRQRA